MEILMHYLYRITNLINRKIYIGQTINPYKRWAGHKSAAKPSKRTGNMFIASAIHKYGSNNFEFEVIACCKTQDDANYLEIELIKQYDSLSISNGYNITSGGRKTVCDKIRGPKSEAHKEKIRQSLMGHFVSDETKKKQSEIEHTANSGSFKKGQLPWNATRPPSEKMLEHLRKLAASQKGKTRKLINGKMVWVDKK
jgi:group I intron endonuclease